MKVQKKSKISKSKVLGKSGKQIENKKGDTKKILKYKKKGNRRYKEDPETHK